jgi:tetratricopeptide (TPR) repeat protein
MACHICHIPPRMVNRRLTDQGGRARASLSGLLDDIKTLEPFTRLDRSALWSINSDYWRAQGNRAFLRDGVPYYATSDGTLSTCVAQFLAQWARIAQAEQLTLIEIGPGSGLFARCTLVQYQAMRLRNLGLPAVRYIAVDVAESMTEAMLTNGVMPIDGVEFAFAQIDVGKEHDSLSRLLNDELDRGAHVLVAANYAIDSLPLRHFRKSGADLLELQVAAMRRAHSSESDMRPVTLRQRFEIADPDDPIVSLASDFLLTDGSELTINSGALNCINAILSALGDRGLFVFNDYASGTGNGGEQPWQSFGGSVAAGLHFPSIDRFIETLGAGVVAPLGDMSFVSRLAGHHDEATREAYVRAFSMADARYAHGRTAAARLAHSAGHLDAALAAYESALTAQPNNWSLRLEVAEFVATSVKNMGVARALLEEVLAANPISTVAMNLMGDCDFADGAIGCATTWYQKAEAVSGGMRVRG